MQGLVITALRIMQDNGLIIPARLSEENLISEATEYAESYKCDAETAINDVLDEYAYADVLDREERMYGDHDHSMNG